jgi:hypothetical protein
MLLQMMFTKRGPHLAVSAIWIVVGDLLKIMSRVNSRDEAGRFGAIVPWSLVWEGNLKSLGTFTAAYEGPNIV